MKYFSRLLICMFALAMLTLTSGVFANGPGEATHIIVFRQGFASGPSAVALERAHGLGVRNVYEHAINGMAAVVPAGRLNALRNDPRVAYVEPNQMFSTFAQSTPTGITRARAASNSLIDIDGIDDRRVNVDVAVIDSGVYAHADLNLYRHVNCVGTSTSRTCYTGGTDGNGHGTHVAGTIGALDNSIGVVGMAPGARIWGVRVLNNAGSGYTSNIIAGIDYVTANASYIEVANMSLGCECYSAAQDSAIARSVAAGVVYIVAAGNSAKDASTFSPANHPDVLAVSALADFNGLPGGGAASTCRADVDDTLASFSNFGYVAEIAAPGTCINSTWMGGGYNTISGTSMASPHVAGAAALLASRSNPYNRSTVFSIYNTLINTGNYNWVDDSGDGYQEPLLDVSNTTYFNPVMQ